MGELGELFIDGLIKSADANIDSPKIQGFSQTKDNYGSKSTSTEGQNIISKMIIFISSNIKEIKGDKLFEANNYYKMFNYFKNFFEKINCASIDYVNNQDNLTAVMPFMILNFEHALPDYRIIMERNKNKVNKYYNTPEQKKDSYKTIIKNYITNKKENVFIRLKTLFSITKVDPEKFQNLLNDYINKNMNNLNFEEIENNPNDLNFLPIDKLKLYEYLDKIDTEFDKITDQKIIELKNSYKNTLPGINPLKYVPGGRKQRSRKYKRTQSTRKRRKTQKTKRKNKK